MVFIQHYFKYLVKHLRKVTLSLYFLVSHMTYVGPLTLILLNVVVYSHQYLKYLDQLPILLKPKRSLDEHLQQQNEGQSHLFNLLHLILFRHTFLSRILMQYHNNSKHYNDIKFTCLKLFNLHLICSFWLKFRWSKYFQFKKPNE